jgi:predicted nucleotidyltransferase
LNRPLTILKTLSDHGVEFIVVGGVAGVALGVPIDTLDIDVVHLVTPSNVQRLLAALAVLDAHYRHRPELRPSESHLASRGHQLLDTRLGYLDVLGAIGKGHTYADLLPHSVEVAFSASLRCRVLDLETQIAIKEEIGAAKDLAVLPLLRRTLEERRRLKKPHF